ncbi:hypothetical protein [Vibrio alfacsensis]|uniref:hypothetical protein n=1 Tax=Vibrio alfacsensis TaxID=1074311 RepID=UPI0040698A3B
MQITNWIQLCLRELEGAPIKDTENIEVSFADTVHFLKWKANKREIRAEEVKDRCWIKSCTGGYITEVHLHAGGSLDEYTLFGRLHTKGHWELDGGVLHITIYKGENTYELSVVGNREPSIHSAIESKNGEVHSYLKLTPISQ